MVLFKKRSMEAGKRGSGEFKILRTANCELIQFSSCRAGMISLENWSAEFTRVMQEGSSQERLAV
jgi:hypothetical protein